MNIICIFHWKTIYKEIIREQCSNLLSIPTESVIVLEYSFVCLFLFVSNKLGNLNRKRNGSFIKMLLLFASLTSCEVLLHVHCHYKQLLSPKGSLLITISSVIILVDKDGFTSPSVLLCYKCFYLDFHIYNQYLWTENNPWLSVKSVISGP